MSRKSRYLGALGAISLAVLAVGAVSHQEPLEPDAPAARPTSPPSDLLQAYPFDRITLLDDSVFFIEPVSPRPLPPPVMVSRNPRLGRVSGTSIPLEGNIGLPGEPSKVQSPESARTALPEHATEITVHLAHEAATGRGDVRDFKIQRNHIKKIEYFEDALLAEGTRLVQARDYTRAFEHYLRVQQRAPEWPGLSEHVDKLLFEEGRQSLRDGDASRGLRLLRELHRRRNDYPELQTQIASAYAGRIDRAIDLGLYPEGRRLLRELEEVAADSPETQNIKTNFQKLARDRARRKESGTNAEKLDAMVEGLRIWPNLDELHEEYMRLFQAEPTLDVAVLDVPSPPGPWIHSPADERITPLLFQPILADDTEESRRGQSEGQLAAGIESSDLGHRLVIKLRSGVSWSDDSRHVSAADVARTLIDRCDPRSPDDYQARWADILEKIQPLDDRQVELRLSRPLLKPGFWLNTPISAAHAGVDGRISTPTRGRRLVSSGLFECFEAEPHTIDLRLRGEAETGRVRRVREIRFDRSAAALTAFQRGEVTLLAHVPADQTAKLAAVQGIQVGRYERPAIHVLSLDGRNLALRNRTLRRAISYAIDRNGLLAESIVRGPLNDSQSVSDGVFPRGSNVDATGVKPLEHDPILALALASLGKGELKLDSLKFKLEYPAVAEVEAAIPRIVEALALARIEVDAVAVPESQLESKLRSGRQFEMAYRIVRTNDPILDAGTLIFPGYDAPPSTNPLAAAASPRILQLLLQLEKAVDWPSARGLATQIDREIRDELPVIPLWQLNEHYAWWNRLQGPAETLDRLYDGIETWEIAPWLAKDP